MAFAGGLRLSLFLFLIRIISNRTCGNKEPSPMEDPVPMVKDAALISSAGGSVVRSLFRAKG
jgi:hypothetical protein